MQSAPKSESKHKTVLITGATRGLGLAIVRALDELPDVRVVMAVRDIDAGERVARTLRNPARVMRLDMSKMDDVMEFARTWNEPLFGLIQNAGLQLTGPTSFNADGFEETLAVNFLAPTWLSLALLPHLRGARVMCIGSGTHNPENRMATVFGFRGGRFSTVTALARGETNARSDAQAGRDRYATSKLLITAATMELARRHPETTFITLDPGLMPGTGLARTAPWPARVAWSTLLRWLVPLLPDASTPERSARAACNLLTRETLENGGVYDFTAQPSARVWRGLLDPTLGVEALDQASALLTARWPLPR
jgi:NAD(P)-dependent dehydrogenase (short-subunit alcohol dehydrogenase family)